MKKLLLTLSLGVFLASCGGKEKAAETTNATTAPETEQSPSDYDPNRGEGKFKDVQVSPTLDKALASEGEKVAGTKCLSCHKLTDERLVGPGWKGVTERRTADWILNFVTNPDPMIDKDPELQAQLEICLVRMPNQSVSDDEAYQIYEYMRQNDGVQ